jgi:hypothetical protein
MEEDGMDDGSRVNLEFPAWAKFIGYLTLAGTAIWIVSWLYQHIPK